jgi:hypothetical protein
MGYGFVNADTRDRTAGRVARFPICFDTEGEEGLPPSWNSQVLQAIGQRHSPGGGHRRPAS